MLAARAGAALGLARTDAAFFDHEPRLAEVAGFDPRALCLPVFAAEGGHVLDDIPAALAEAGFPGRVLPALCRDARGPGLIGAARAAAEQPAA